MSGVPTTSASIAAGSPASDSAIDRRCVVVGCTSIGSGLSNFLRSTDDMRAAKGYGDAVDTACQIIEQKLEGGGAGVKYPAAVMTLAATTAGSYGTIDTSGITGTATCAVDATVTPLGTYDAWLLVSNGGTLGTAGITVRWSLNGGGLYSNPVALGIATGYTIPNSGARFEFSPSSANVTAIHTLVNEEFTDANAHFILTTGTVHTNSGVADVLSAGTYPSATSQATTVARVNAIRTALLSHFGKGSGASPAIHINVGGDAAGAATLTATPVATDYDSVLALALVIKTVLNAHEASTAFHTIADATNTISSTSPAAGTLATGDIVKVRTIAPTPLAADLFDGSTTPPTGAMVTLGKSPQSFSILAMDFPVDAAMAATIKLGLDYMASRGKDVVCISRARIPDAETSETETAWSASLAADFLAFADFRQVIRSGYGLTTDATTGRQYLRSTFAQFVADVVRVDRSTWPCSPNDRTLANVRLSNASGIDVGHDEGTRGTAAVLSDESLGNRFACDFRDSRAPSPEGVYASLPWTMFGPSDTIKNLQTLRVILAIKRVALAAAFRALGGKVFYDAADPNVFGSLPTLPEPTRNAIQSSILAALSSEFKDDIQNASDGDIETGLVRIPSTVTVTGGNLVTIPGYIEAKVFGYVISIPLTISIQE